MDKQQKDIFVYSYCLRTTLDENSRLKNLNSHLAAQNEQMKSDYSEQSSKNLRFKAQIKNIKKENAQMQDQNKLLLCQLSNLDNEYQKLKNLTTHYEKQVKNADLEKIELKKQNSILEKQISMNNDFFSARIQKLEDDLSTLKNFNLKICKQCEELKLQSDEDKKLLIKYESIISQIQEEKDECKKIIEALGKHEEQNEKFEDSELNEMRNKLFNLPFFEANGFSNEEETEINFPHLLFCFLLDNANEEKIEFLQKISKVDKEDNINEESENKKECEVQGENINENDDEMKKECIETENSNDENIQSNENNIPSEYSLFAKQITHLQKIVSDPDIYTKSVHRYGKNYFGHNLEVFLFYIIEPILNNILLLPRILELLRLVETSTNSEYFDESLKLAFNKLNEHAILNDNILLLLQCAYASNLLPLSLVHQICISIIPEELKDKRNHLFEYKFNKSKICNLTKDKEISDLKKQIDCFQFVRKNEERKKAKEHVYNMFNSTILDNESKKPEGRRYNDYFLSVCTIAYIYGAKSYNFFRNFLPLPHETVIREWFSPSINSFLEKIFDISMINDILENFISNEDLSKGFNATIAVDAAKFKEINGQKLISLFPEYLKHINPESLYNDIFVYYLQPIDISIKPFPIHIQLTENGNATSDTLKTLFIIEEILSQKGIVTRYIATDGDRQYDSMHDEFFKIVWNLHHGGKTFPQIIRLLVEKDIHRIPISDFLHSIKLLRNYFAKSGIIINNYSVSKPEDLDDEIYNLGKT